MFYYHTKVGKVATRAFAVQRAQSEAQGSHATNTSKMEYNIPARLDSRFYRLLYRLPLPNGKDDERIVKREGLVGWFKGGPVAP